MHSFQVMHLFDASKGRGTRRGRVARGGGETTREGRGKTKERNTKRQTESHTGKEKQISHNHALLMCGNALERGFINVVDSRRSRKHKEHFALQDFFIKKSNAYSNCILYSKMYVRFPLQQHCPPLMSCSHKSQFSFFFFLHFCTLVLESLVMFYWW